eukprot:CAMPEP_0197660574 /NCGR_PEP_ID=MMETSP1338-20131121/50931_1 /TAXON_ID=43686 ORGANISM="Pelagodinium beii, Strain RCC1491" /NCGR_SAMPLE_ID=MMETSP1338 /ASSEMBLY_ACC=CAM_ASM_000754 /LENGTH=150 /DNA_ID=CAMNT_0043237951 /DNA_START=178 /DNA_END=630 /DNA_ORIENTATION=+
MHGIVEEAGEVFEEVRAKRDANLTRDADDKVVCEIGDVLWYVTSLSLEMGVEMAMPDAWPEATTVTSEPEVWLMAAASKLSGRVKKSLRKDKSLEEFVAAMALHRDELLQRCAEVAAASGASLQRCAIANVRKLKGRFERGSVQGDGDSR